MKKILLSLMLVMVSLVTRAAIISSVESGVLTITNDGDAGALAGVLNGPDNDEAKIALLSNLNGDFSKIVFVGNYNDGEDINKLYEKISGKTITSIDFSQSTFSSSKYDWQTGTTTTVNIVGSIQKWRETLQEVTFSNNATDFTTSGLFDECRSLTKVTLGTASADLDYSNNKTAVVSGSGDDKTNLETLLRSNNYNISAGPKIETTLSGNVLTINKLDPSATDADLANLTSEELANVKTIKLEGAFTNQDTQAGYLLEKMFDKYGFTESNLLEMLDLSACQGFVSKYESVSDNYSLANPQVNGNDVTTFTSTKNDANGQSFITEKFYKKIKGIAFPKECENFTFIQKDFFTGAPNLETVVISNGIRAIDNAAFQYCYKLNSVTFPVGNDGKNTLEEIGIDAFQDCCTRQESQEGDHTLVTAVEGLGSIDLSNTKITQIRVGTFNDCSYLSSVSLPNTVNMVRASSFKKTFKLTSLNWTNLPIEYIGTNAFELSGLTSMNFPTAIKIIDERAFQESHLSVVDLQLCHSLNLIANHSFENITELEYVYICTHQKTIKGGEGGGAFDKSTNIKTVQLICCPSTKVDLCVCERNAFDQNTLYGGTDVANMEKAAKLIYCEDNEVTGVEVENHDSGVLYDNGYTYQSAFDFFVGNWKGDLLLTQHNLDASWKGTSYNGWQQFVTAGDPILVPDGKFLRTYSRADGEKGTVLPEGINAYRAVGYVSGAANVNDPSVGGYIQLVKLEQEVVMKNSAGDSRTVTKSYVPENTGVVLISDVTDESGFFLIIAPYDGTTTLTEYPNTPASDAEDNVRNFMVPSEGSDLKVYPSTPWPYVDEASVTHRNFGLYKEGDTYKWYRFLPSQADNTDYDLRDHYAYAHLPADLFTNPNEKEGDSPNLDQTNAILTQEDQGNGSSMALNFVIVDELTGVKTIKNIDSSEGDFWYTIQGVKVAHPTKGVYIHNHRKVVIK